MPSPIIHLQLAHELSERLNIKLSKEFLLDTISPDAIHMVQNANWEDKAMTHFYDLADQDYSKAIITAYEQTTSAGYCFHLYTDYYWREHVYTPFFQCYKDKMPRSALHALYYQDMAHIDRYYLQQADWIPEIKRMLLNAKVNPILKLSCDAIKDWSTKVCEQDLCYDGQAFNNVNLNAFDIQQINQFIEIYLPIMIEELTQLGIELK
ncbi:MAG TPA: hypothetical protein DCY20_01960 [Firmicutes bacterium]|nr:hypothetical protein [Bacillota bacterium]